MVKGENPGPRRARRTETAGRDDRDIRTVILDATRRLLGERRFDEIAVADILAAAEISRGSFYFYFESKHDVLAELVRQAVGQGHVASEPWLRHENESERHATVRHGISVGARLWREQAPVLRAIVENWRTDPKLTELWLQQMNGYTDNTTERIERDGVDAVDPRALGTALTWLGERLYYLAAIGVPPFDDEEALVGVLTHIWMSSLYPGDAAP
ncbi:TetR/AcrR family transcriptional regulator [Actinomadura sp. DC4]|uniref:TetR/AcrR family transcriptional regulator n=1 Tax=Actinomadura sp. DC4 TaxID=3055069 RepID=UPI0025B0A89B|nr:TetR/AcrR family transcriptional regulator [Actinomadura sp. DC4]MDN3352286.1 TetR/AcrR family transcriptional regulator [Actinomadura sp. DC4]